MNLMQLLATVGGLGGGGQVPASMGYTPNTVPITGINPAAPPPGQMDPVTATGKRGFLDRLAMGLFQSQNPGQQSTPDQRRNAMLQLGLGMLAAGGQGKGLGEGLLGAYSGAAGNFQGAMDRAYTASERKRLEERDEKRRQEDLDWRKLTYTTEAADRQLDRQLRVKQTEASSGDDRVRAEIARMQLEQEREDRELLKPIMEKVRRNEPLTKEEKDLYQLLRTGRQPSFNPFEAMMMGGGLGGLGGAPGAAPGNPLLNDPRLNF